MVELLKYKTFPTKESAEELISLLQENSIKYEFVDNTPSVDSNFMGSQLTNYFEIKVLGDDFSRVDEIIKKQVSNSLNNISDDYYLYEFSNDELYDILIKPDEWNEIDYQLAQKLLKEKGQNISSEFLTKLKHQRYDDLAKPEEVQRTWIVAGYFMALLGGLIGVFIGYHLWQSKKTIPDGRKVFSFTNESRKKGKTIFIIGMILLPFWFAARLMLDD